jgi:predicted transcriptional regulator
MKLHKWKDIKAQGRSAERVRQLEQEALAELADLRALREAAGVTQEDLAAKLETNQGTLSKIERRDDHRVSVLREFVEALGGELEVVAIIKGKRVKLAG